MAEHNEMQSKRQVVQNMFDEGVLKQDAQGQYMPVTDPAEQQHIKA